MSSPAQTKARRERLKAAGICVNCGKVPAVPLRLRCEPCNVINLAKGRRHYAKHHPEATPKPKRGDGIAKSYSGGRVIAPKAETPQTTDSGWVGKSPEEFYQLAHEKFPSAYEPNPMGRAIHFYTGSSK